MIIWVGSRRGHRCGPSARPGKFLRQRDQPVNLRHLEAGVDEQPEAREAEQALHEPRSQHAAREAEQPQRPVQDRVEPARGAYRNDTGSLGGAGATNGWGMVRGAGRSITGAGIGSGRGTGMGTANGAGDGLKLNGDSTGSGAGGANTRGAGPTTGVSRTIGAGAGGGAGVGIGGA